VVTLIVVGAAGILAFSGAWSRIWPIFGASNQLVAALALFVASLWFLMRNKPTAYTLVPAIFMFLTTTAALGIQCVSYARNGQYSLAGLSVVLLVLALVMVGEVCQAFRYKRGKNR
jgi:carbon starvation protein